MARSEAYGLLPGAARHRPRPAGEDARRRAPGLDPGRPPIRRPPASAALAAGGDPLPQLDLRSLPVRSGGLGGRLRAWARLCPGDADAADLRLRPRRDDA